MARPVALGPLPVLGGVGQPGDDAGLEGAGSCRSGVRDTAGAVAWEQGAPAEAGDWVRSTVFKMWICT